MPYGLKQDISYCQVDDHVVLLDVAQDRYFRLSGELEQDLLIYSRDSATPSASLDRLVASGILIEQEFPSYTREKAINRPVRSAVEQFARSGKSGSGTIYIETLWLVFSMHIQLKRRALKSILESAVTCRRKHARLHANNSDSLENLTVQAALQFLLARRYVPIKPTCLLDSLCLLRLLSRRGLPAQLVFGVALEPFTAHCWLQTGDLALNETLTVAGAHTPIRTV